MDFVKENAVDLEKGVVMGKVPKRDDKRSWCIYRLNVEEEGILLAETFGFTNTIMCLLTPDGEELAENNDLDRGKVCSRIAVVVGAGEYYLVVHEYRAASGPFGLTVCGAGFPLKVDQEKVDEVMNELEEIQAVKEKERWKQIRESRIKAMDGELEDGKWSGKIEGNKRYRMLLAKIEKAGKYKITVKSDERFTLLFYLLGGNRVTYFVGQGGEDGFEGEKVVELKKEEYFIQVYLQGRTEGEVEVTITPVEEKEEDEKDEY